MSENNGENNSPKSMYTLKTYFAKPGRYEVDLSLDVNVNHHHHHTSHATPNVALGRAISPGPNSLYGQRGSSPSGSSSLSSNGAQNQSPFRTSTPLSLPLSPIVSSTMNRRPDTPRPNTH